MVGAVTDKIKAEDLANVLAAAHGKVKNKYGNKRVERHGMTFDSVREADRYDELRLLEKGGEICHLERQVPFPLNGRDGPIKTPTGKQAFYIADFTYVDWRLNGAKVVEDAKGVETEIFKLKRAILAADGVEIVTT